MSGIKNINHSVPILRHTLLFLTGIAISDLLPVGNKLLIIISISFLFLALILKSSKRASWQKIYSIIICFLFISSGAAYTKTYNNTKFNQAIPTSGFYSGRINEMSPASNNREKLIMQLKSATTDTSEVFVNEKIVMYVPDSILETDIIPGDYIGFKGKLHLIESSNNPGDFNYQKYMNHKGIRYQSYIFNLPYHINSQNISIKTFAVNIRSKLLDAYREAGIDGREFAVLSALTLGEKNFIDNELKQQFSNSGAMHVLAVSGLHVGILFFVFSFLLKPLDRTRKTKNIKVLLLITLLWSYALITGMSPSVLRATTMFSFLVIGQNLNRHTNIYNTLALSAFMLMLINPDIIYEVGFQLSYTAVLSIVFFQPKIANWFSFNNRIANSIWGLFAVSLSAQIGTLPFSLFYFHQFPVYFWVSNFIVIPAATILLYGSILFFIMMPFSVLNNLIGNGLSAVAKTMNIFITKIDNLPGAVISDIWITQTTVIICYAIIFVLGLLCLSRKYKYFMVLISLFLILFIKHTVHSYQIHNQNYIVFYNHYNENLLSIINGRNHYYFNQSDTLSTYSKRILNNSRGYFHTKQPVFLPRDTIINDNLYRTNEHIFFKNMHVQITKNFSGSENINDIPAHLTWKTKMSEIYVNKKEKISLLAIKNNKMSYFRQDLKNDNAPIKTDQRAIIVEAW
ncbi:MAG: ComEC family competence protein [Prolixibacteraceae bacterium]|nr:ComEC family competence protein [Prolixibacteraceae bacterium]